MINFACGMCEWCNTGALGPRLLLPGYLQDQAQYGKLKYIFANLVDFLSFRQSVSNSLSNYFEMIAISNSMYGIIGNNFQKYY